MFLWVLRWDTGGEGFPENNKSLLLFMKMNTSGMDCFYETGLISEQQINVMV